jgi:hypothetical protein
MLRKGIKMAGKQIVPSLELDSFSCPHVNCGAISHQTWLKLYVDTYENNDRPWVPTTKEVLKFKSGGDADHDQLVYFEKKARGNVFLDVHENTVYLRTELVNVVISKCYSCKEISIWRGDELIYPPNHVSIEPNEGMPPDVRADFLEASAILDKSPRGAAALLRLSIQKLLIHLGEKGRNINDEIGNLVQKGLDKRIQQALDVVRVVGNSAVHPGQIDLDDDKTIARKLFGLVNVIVESQITQAKHIDEMYETVVPDSVKAQIEKRDGPKQLEHKKTEE